MKIFVVLRLFYYLMEIIFLSNVVVDDKSSTIFSHVLHTIYSISTIKKSRSIKFLSFIRCTFDEGDDTSSFVDELLLLLLLLLWLLLAELNGGKIGGGGGKEN